MNKLLTTITLLCFSVAANADIYFCQARHYAEATQNSSMTRNREQFLDPNIYGWIVDTERGISRATFTKYEGSCEEDAEFIRCEAELNGTRLMSAVIIKSRLHFVEVSIFVDDSIGTSTSGTCTKA